MKSNPPVLPKLFYHYSPVSGLFKFSPLTHFGTEQAARERGLAGKYKSACGQIYTVSLAVRHPLWIPDLSDSVRGNSHSCLRLTDQLHYEIKPSVITALERDSVFTAAGPGFRDTLSAAASLTSILEKKGYDCIGYLNRYEDRGSASVIIFHSSDVEVITTCSMGLASPSRFLPESVDAHSSGLGM